MWLGVSINPVHCCSGWIIHSVTILSWQRLLYLRFGIIIPYNSRVLDKQNRVHMQMKHWLVIGIWKSEITMIVKCAFVNELSEIQVLITSRHFALNSQMARSQHDCYFNNDTLILTPSWTNLIISRLPSCWGLFIILRMTSLIRGWMLESYVEKSRTTQAPMRPNTKIAAWVAMYWKQLKINRLHGYLKTKLIYVFLGNWLHKLLSLCS